MTTKRALWLSALFAACLVLMGIGWMLDAVRLDARNKSTEAKLTAALVELGRRETADRDKAPAAILPLAPVSAQASPIAPPTAKSSAPNQGSPILPNLRETVFEPIAGKTLVFSDDFKEGYKKNWDTWFNSFGAGKDAANSRGYDHKNQPWIAVDPDYAPDVPTTIELIPGGGVRLLTIKNPKPDDPRFTAYNVKGLYLASVLMTRDFQRKVGSYTEYDMTLSNESGSFSAAWSLGAEGEEFDVFEHLGIWADPSKPQSNGGKEDRLFWGAPHPSDNTFVTPTPSYQRGLDFKVKNPDGTDSETPDPIFPIAGVRHTFGLWWRPDRLDWYVDRKWRGGGKMVFKNPQRLIVNNVVGGWDGQGQVANIKDRTAIILHSVKSWQ